MNDLRIAKAPLFRCPVHDGAADPCVIWNRQEKSWFMFYSMRDPFSVLKGDNRMSFCNGMNFGIASSKNNGTTWTYRGMPENLNFEPGRNTWWGPEVVYFNNEYHLFSAYVQGFPTVFDDIESHIVHYSSPDLWHWKFDKFVKPDTHQQNDVTVFQMPDGKWRMYFKNGKDPVMMESLDLYNWQDIGMNVDGVLHNATNVFSLGGSNWLINDAYDGFGVFKSDDFINWVKQDYRILSEPGSRDDDGSRVHHSFVVPFSDRAYIFYFLHPERFETILSRATYNLYHEEVNFRRTVIQVAMIREQDGQLICKRNEPFDFFMPNLD